MNIARLEKELGSACRIIGPTDNSRPHIESIGLQGFSRGAVTAFATAKKLNDLNIPIDIIANQPVPGQMNKHSLRSLFLKYSDLRDCHNIRSAVTLLATCSLENGVLENNYFQQMVAKFPPSTNAKNWLVPHQTHLGWTNSWIVPLHISKLFDQAGYSTRAEIYDDSYDEHLQREYQAEKNNLYFTPSELCQPIFGAKDANIRIDPVYEEMIKQQAQAFLGEEIISLTFRKARAISTISKMENLGEQDKIALCHFVLQDDNKAKEFTIMVNKINDFSEYLIHVVADERSNKSSLIAEHSQEYKKEVFTKYYQYLSIEKPTNAEKGQFMRDIQSAEERFKQNALSIDRGISRKSMKIMANGLLHVTGLFLVTNTLHKALTGNWLFFDETRSEKVMGKVFNDVKETVRNNKENNNTSNRFKQEIKSFKEEHSAVEAPINSRVAQYGRG